jgi:CRISPR-associated Cas5-like protein
MPNDFLVIDLEATIASFGGSGAKLNRGTLMFPTLSAVTGALCRCLGLPVWGERHEEICQAFGLSVAELYQPGMMVDYQTALPEMTVYKSRKKYEFGFRHVVYVGADKTDPIPFTKTYLVYFGKEHTCCSQKFKLIENTYVVRGNAYNHSLMMEA